MLDISNIKANNRLYGGVAGIKVGVTIDGINWLVKFPGNLRERQLENVNMSYSNSPLCEYLGSHLFEYFGIPVHETKLAIRGGKEVVMCRDFREDKVMYHFSELKATFEPAFVTADGFISDGCGTDLSEALLVIREHPILHDVKDVEKRFWQMFIVDFILGNPDRNNGNWGILVDNDKVSLTPVFDCGNALCDKWDDTKMQLFMSDENLFKGEAYGSKVCFYTENNKRIKPYRFLKNTDNVICKKVLKELLVVWDTNNVFDKFQNLMRKTNSVTETQFEFYSKLLITRVEKLKEINNSLTDISSFD